MATYMSEEEVLAMPYKRFVAYMDDIEYINSDKDKQKQIDHTLERKFFGYDSTHDEFNKQLSSLLRQKG